MNQTDQHSFCYASLNDLNQYCEISLMTNPQKTYIP